MRVLWISLAVLGATALVQAVITVASGSVALLGDTLHNAADALTAVPLGIAFLAARRPASRRYTYGYGRAEDLAGVRDRRGSSRRPPCWPPSRPSRACSTRGRCPASSRSRRRRCWASPATRWWPATGSGPAGRSGRRPWSPTGCTPGPTGSPHWPCCSRPAAPRSAGPGPTPLVGLLITVAILAVLRQAAREIYRRLMDAVDPALVDAAEAALRDTPGVLGTGAVRLRWIGHRLRAECEVLVDAGASAVAAHQVAASAEHHLLHALPHLAGATVHADPSRPPAPTTTRSWPPTADGRAAPLAQR